MRFEKTDFEGLVVIEPRVFEDDRGHFFESWRRDLFEAGGISAAFVQDNQSFSTYGTVRGLHFQKPPWAQAKLVRLAQGRVLDVVADLRTESRTFGKVFSLQLSAENKKQLFIPRGFAHGFSVLSEQAVFVYRCDQVYHRDSEGGILFSDPDLAIDWGLLAQKAFLSPKDKLWESFAAYKESPCF